MMPPAILHYAETSRIRNSGPVLSLRGKYCEHYEYSNLVFKTFNFKKVNLPLRFFLFTAMNTNNKRNKRSYSTEFKRAYLAGLLPPSAVNDVPPVPLVPGKINPYTIYMAMILSMQTMNN